MHLTTLGSRVQAVALGGAGMLLLANCGTSTAAQPSDPPSDSSSAVGASTDSQADAEPVVFEKKVTATTPVTDADLPGAPVGLASYVNRQVSRQAISAVRIHSATTTKAGGYASLDVGASAGGGHWSVASSASGRWMEIMGGQDYAGCRELHKAGVPTGLGTPRSGGVWKCLSKGHVVVYRG